MGSFTKKLTGGADLAHPRLSLGWILGAIVAVFLLVGIFLFVIWGWGQAQQKLPGVGSVTAPARTYMS